MGLFHQFIEVIEWKDDRSDRMVYEFPVHNNEIKMGASLTVRESQVAIFINEGQIADVFEPGRYNLSTENMPILTKLKSWKYGFNSPFKAEVYFVNTKQFLNQRWGTKNPIMMRDPDFGIIRLRGFGIYGYRISDCVTFMREVFGTNPEVTTESISPQLSQYIVSGISDYVAENKIPALDLAMNYEEISEGMLQKLSEKFKEYGLTITNFVISNLSLPPEVEAAMDKRTQMGVLGNLDKYTKYQTAEAIRDAAQNEGGGFASMGAGLGVSSAMGQAMANSMNTNAQTNSAPVTQAAAVGQKPCPKCNKDNPISAKFCLECGEKLVSANKFCIQCGANLAAGAKFCQECGTKQQ